VPMSRPTIKFFASFVIDFLACYVLSRSYSCIDLFTLVMHYFFVLLITFSMQNRHVALSASVTGAGTVTDVLCPLWRKAKPLG
jgi:hypothetical protein